MRIGILKEMLKNETRVAMLPEDIKTFIDKKITFNVESNAGKKAFINDDNYKSEGINISNNIYDQSDLIIKINPPSVEEIDKMKKNTTLISLLSSFTNHEIIKKLKTQNITSVGLDLIPRTTYAQSMDVLSSQSTVSGYCAVLNAACHLGKFFPMLMTPAGTIKPASVLVIGAGVAGLQAIATASRLGAKVEAFDVRPAAKEQVESLGAKFLYMDLDDSAESDKGYAIEMNEEFIRKEMELLHNASKKVDAIITTALIFGKPAPILIKDYMVNDMKPGSCIIDLAAENGGNCELTQPNKVFEHNNVIIDGTLNLPAQLPYDSSKMFSKNISKLLNDIINDDLEINFENDILKECLVTHDGQITHERTKMIIEGDK